jgi:hypothetical protein
MTPIRIAPLLLVCLWLAAPARGQPPPGPTPAPSIRASAARLAAQEAQRPPAAAVAPAGRAASPAARWEDIASLVGHTVRVVRFDRTEVNGRLRHLSSDGLGVEQKGALVRVLRPEIWSVQRQASDSLVNGVLLGAVAGFLGGMAAEGAIMDGVGGETGFPDAATWAVAAIGGGLGGLLGGLGDRGRHEHVVVYRAER